VFNELRDRITAYLANHRVCVVSTSGTLGAWAMPALYRVVANALEVECLLPRWADVTFHLEQDPQVLLIIGDACAQEKRNGLRWLQYRGTARPSVAPEWSSLLPEGRSTARPEERYVAMRIKPARIDLIDETRGWGARETLEL
jgi:hypothetical protein